jgi:hypothetical protein
MATFSCGKSALVRLLAVFSTMLCVGAVAGEGDLSIKGDGLGMTLEQFKAKYSRSVQGDSRKAPFCSDTQPGKSISTLLAEEWHFGAGVVTCSTHFLFEKHKGVAPTLAGRDTDLFIYHFVDGKLYKVTVLFPHGGFAAVSAAFLSKYGEPDARTSETLQNRLGAQFQSDNLVWGDGISSLTLTERLGSIDRSALFLVDTLVDESVKSKGPGPRTDDI